MTPRRSLATCLSALAVLMSVGCASPRASEPAPVNATAAVDRARTRLLDSIEDVAGSTAHRYGVRDDRGHEMDTVKIIAIPESGGFVGLYHSFHDDIYDVHLATSTDLMTWTWRVRLATRASMPTIKPATDGGYAVAWEQEPDNHLRFSYYPSWDALLRGVPSKSLDAPQHLSDCAEGTPNLYAASSTSLDVGFHFYDHCELDRQARGTTDWTTWNPAARPALEDAVRANRVAGGVGDRDVIRFDGVDLTLIEGQVVKDDWRSWRIYLYDEATGRAEPIDFHTDAMSFAFTNPTIERITIGGQEAILVTLFVPGEGALAGEAGELIYYRVIGSPSATPSVSATPASAPVASSTVGIGLRAVIEDVTMSTAHRYGATDDRGHSMDGAKIIRIPEADAFAAVYHSGSETDQALHVHLATSTNLMDWHWQREMAPEASQPTIKAASDGGYVVTWDPTTVKVTYTAPTFSYYETWAHVLANTPKKTFSPRLSLSTCGEGTPNLYAASSTLLDVGFHYFADCTLDRQGRGTTDWTTWTATRELGLDLAILRYGVQGGIGDRDAIRFDERDLTLVESMGILDDWSSFRIYLYDVASNTAEPLHLRTHTGSVSFTNPTVEQIEIGGRRAILVTLFIPQEGAGRGEVGELVYYRTY